CAGISGGDRTDCRPGLADVWRSRLTHCEPRAKDRKRQRINQPGDDADVDLLRRLLLIRTLPGDLSAVHQSPSANGPKRLLARQHPRRHTDPASVASPAGDDCLGWGLVRAGVEVVPLDLATS